MVDIQTLLAVMIIIGVIDRIGKIRHRERMKEAAKRNAKLKKLKELDYEDIPLKDNYKLFVKGRSKWRK